MDNNLRNKKSLEYDNIIKDDSKIAKLWWKKWKSLFRSPGNLPPPPFSENKETESENKS